MKDMEKQTESLDSLREENHKLRCDLYESKIQLLTLENKALQVDLKSLKDELSVLQTKYNELNELYRKSTIELDHVMRDHSLVVHSRWWRITSPLRKLGVMFKTCKPVALTVKATRILFTQGPRALISKLRAKKRVQKIESKFEISEQQRKLESETVFENPLKISVLVPLYNTPLRYLKEMIDSVRNQTYANWELCLADGSDDAHSEVGDYVQSLAKNDPRIVYKKLENNLGIAANTNACIEISSGDYIALFDHDDLLHASALFRVMQTISNEGADFIYTDEGTFFNDDPNNIVTAHFKADFAIDTLRSYNYICHLTVFSRALMEQVGMFRPECDGSQDYDIILRLTEKAQKIVHIPEILYFWRGHANSTAQDIGSKPYIVNAAHKALQDHLERVGLEATVTDSSIPSTYRIRYTIKGEPLISILIPNKDQVETLDTCVRSIIEKTTYPNYEIVIIENNSTSQLTFLYYKQLQEQYKNVRVVTWQDKFNYSAINNFGFKEANGDYVVLLNNDVEIITPSWIEEMLMFAQRKDVGAVGSMLYYPDDTIQHAGVILGIGGVAGHSHKYFPRNDYGYMSRATIAQNLTAVTFACVMMRSDVYREVNGLDEAFEVAFNDVDMCMRIRKAGYLIVFTPYCELYHYESKSRGQEDTPEKVRRFNSEVERFQKRWGKELADGDPYYNPNLTLTHEDFSFRNS